MWKRFLLAFAITGAAALVLALILLVDPLGVSPVAMIEPKPGYAMKDRRFLVQQLIRKRPVRLISVGQLDHSFGRPGLGGGAFGGQFANLAIHGATPHELARVLEAIGRNEPHLRTLVLDLDSGRWCSAKAPRTYHPKAVFPESLYDADRLNDFLVPLNMQMLDTSFEQLAVDLSSKRPRPRLTVIATNSTRRNGSRSSPAGRLQARLRRGWHRNREPKRIQRNLIIPFRHLGCSRALSIHFPPGPS